MKWFKAEYKYRPDRWGHTVQLVEHPEHKFDKFAGIIIDPSGIDEVLEWTNEQSKARRISYDTWQFRSKDEANEFIMLYNLRWS